jgi:hypothetical protein
VLDGKERLIIGKEMFKVFNNIFSSKTIYILKMLSTTNNINNPNGTREKLSFSKLSKTKISDKIKAK